MLCAAAMWPRILLILAAGVAVGGVLAAAPPQAPAVAPLPLTATPVPLDPRDPARRDVGRLRYMGGVALRSSDTAFGGLSGLAAGPGGWLLSVSDTGNWVAFRTVEARGRLVGVSDGIIAPILDENGKGAVTKSASDAEAVTWERDGSAAVSFEQGHRIQLYANIDPSRPATLRASATETLRFAATGGWPSNGGGEALATLSDGSRLWFQEDGQDRDGRSPALRIAADRTVTSLLYTPPEGYRPSDAVGLSPGLVLIVNRRFTPIEGISVILTTATLDREMVVTEVARLTSPLTVDNLEGLALTRVAGRTFVYLVSDDNFLGMQRTLLLKFELLPHNARRPGATPAD
jgi:hypothetical protein